LFDYTFYLFTIKNLIMKNMTFKMLLFGLALIIVSCSKDSPLQQDLSAGQHGADVSYPAVPTEEAIQGATQITGIGYFDVADECNTAGQEASFSLILTGDLEGCLYTYVDDFECSPSGTYREVGREYFVGTYQGAFGTFWTTYRFEAKYEGCNEDGSYIGAEIKGRCQHPIVSGSGTEVFEGVTGRLDFKDDIEAGNYPYRGHLKGL
jgi:hypothetical protein